MPPCSWNTPPMPVSLPISTPPPLLNITQVLQLVPNPIIFESLRERCHLNEERSALLWAILHQLPLPQFSSLSSLRQLAHQMPSPPQLEATPFPSGEELLPYKIDQMPDAFFIFSRTKLTILELQRLPHHSTKNEVAYIVKAYGGAEKVYGIAQIYFDESITNALVIVASNECEKVINNLHGKLRFEEKVIDGKLVRSCYQENSFKNPVQHREALHCDKSQLLAIPHNIKCILANTQQ